MQQEKVKTQIELPRQVDKMLKLIKVEFDLENKSEAVEFVIESIKGEFTPDIEKKICGSAYACTRQDFCGTHQVRQRNEQGDGTLVEYRADETEEKKTEFNLKRS